MRAKNEGWKFDLQVRMGQREKGNCSLHANKKGDVCLFEHSKTDEWASICLQRVGSNGAKKNCDGAEQKWRGGHHSLKLSVCDARKQERGNDQKKCMCMDKL